MSRNDPARAHNRTIEEISRRGAIFNINEGIEIQDSQNCATRLVGWPGNGTRMVSFHLLTHHYAGGYQLHKHPISEESIICISGRGEVNLGRGWVEIEAGNAIFVPPGCMHATRNAPGVADDFIVLSYNCPPPMEYYQAIGLFKNGAFDLGSIDQWLLNSKRGSIPGDCVMRLNDLGGEEKGELKGAEEVSRSGGVFNLFRGARFTGYGCLMRFILWPGCGTKMVGQHTAFHEPGTSFSPHIHPISEDAILCTNGKGQWHLNGRWIDVEEGDIVYGPDNIKHGTGCPDGYDETFYTTGCASPPQPDLY
ncbi:MAG: cupin domain-containing protein, partial [Firmicutes bacterium]|nr:cupin domain-containing protein [Bacillota bacterium]